MSKGRRATAQQIVLPKWLTDGFGTTNEDELREHVQTLAKRAQQLPLTILITYDPFLGRVELIQPVRQVSLAAVQAILDAARQEIANRERELLMEAAKKAAEGKSSEGGNVSEAQPGNAGEASGGE